MKIIQAFIAILLIQSSFLQAEQSHPKEHSIDSLFENREYCVDKITDDKIYVKAENVFVTNEGIFVDVNGEDYLPIPMLHSDAFGCFLPFQPSSGTQYLVSMGNCPYCHRPTNSRGRCINNRCDWFGRLVYSHSE